MKKYIFVSLAAFSILLVFFSLSAAVAGVPRGKSAAPGLIPDELKSMQIEDYFVESKGLPAGSIQNATGNVVVVHKDTNRAYFAATGDAIYQQDVFYTLKDSRCRIKFSTEDIITMGENSKVVVDEIVDDQVLKKKSSVISMLKGKAMFYVVRLFRYKTVSASVKTPTAVTGVRGTKFGVEVRKVGEKVADLSDNSFIYLAQNEPGNFETVVYGFEGTVDVTSTKDGSTQTVGAGENLVLDNIGAGNVVQTDPNTANQFIGETEGGGGTGGIKTQTSLSIAETGKEAITEVKTAETTNDTVSENIAQTQTSLTIVEQDLRPTNRYGYFIAMVTAQSPSGGYYFVDMYISDSLQDLNGTNLSASGYIDPPSKMYVNGWEEEITSINFDLDHTVDGPYPISITELGHNAYMEWGYWTQTNPMFDTVGENNWVNNRGYYIGGDYTSDLQHLSGNIFNYSGGADGTYFTANDGLPGGGINMTGSFNATVNFSTPAVTDFDLSVSGGGHSVSITNATGSIMSGSDFVFSGGGGTCQIDGVAASGKGYGSAYGPDAQAIGGVWGVKAYISPGYQYASGIFHGTR